MPAEPAVGLAEPKALAFALLNQCEIEEDHTILDIHFYKRETAALEVADLNSVMCLVGRVPLDDHRWAIIDHSGPIARADWDEDV